MANVADPDAPKPGSLSSSALSLIMPRIRTMANDTRSSRNSSKKGVSNSKASSTSGSSTMDTSGLRRSAREASSSRKQTMMMPSPSKESVEKRTPVKKKKKSERFEKKSSPSPISLRRSERGKKKPSPSSSSGSKEQESEKEFSSSPSDTEHNENLSREKSREVNRNQKQQQHQKKPAVGMKRKRMDARSYKATFKPQQRRGALQEETDEEMERLENLSQVDSNIGAGSGSKQADEDGEGNVSRERREESVERSCEAVERSDSSLRNGETETLGNPDEVGLSYSEHGCAEEPHEPSDGDGLNGPSSDGIIEETLDDDTDLVTGDKVIASTRKRHTVDVDSNAFSMTTNKDICTSVGDDVSSPSSACKRNNYVETCVTCSKRRRY